MLQRPEPMPRRAILLLGEIWFASRALASVMGTETEPMLPRVS